MSTILREIIPDGTQWGTLGEVLSDWSQLEFGQDLKGASSISFKYAEQGVHRDKLRVGMYVVVEVDGYREWNDSIFYIREETGSILHGDSSQELTVGGVSLRGRLEHVRWMPAVGSIYSDENAFRYRNMTPEEIIRAGVTNYKSRATAQFKDPVNWLTSVATTASGAWSFKVDEVITPPTSVEEIIMKYQELGLVVAFFQGFVLHVVPFTFDKNLVSSDKTDAVQLKVGVSLTQGEYAESSTDLATAVLVQGASDPFKESEVSSNVVQWVFAPQAVIDQVGYHERVLAVDSASNPNTLKIIGEAYLKQYMESKYSVTYEMVDHLYNPYTGQRLQTPTALVDFQCGDSITILTPTGPITETVYAISISSTSSGTRQVGLTLRDYFESWEVVFEQRLRRLGG